MGLKAVSTIKADLGINPNGRVQRFFTDTCRRHMDRYVPRREGNLRKVVHMGANYVEYEMPYSIYQYSTQYENYTTPRNRTILG